MACLDKYKYYTLPLFYVLLLVNSCQNCMQINATITKSADNSVILSNIREKNCLQEKDFGLNSVIC